MTTMRMIVDDCVRIILLYSVSLLTELQISYSNLPSKVKGCTFSDTVYYCIRSCGVNEKRRLAQEHGLNLSEFKGNCKWIWSM